MFSNNVDLWQISDPVRELIVENLQSNESLPVRFSYTITRNPPEEEDSEDVVAVVSGERQIDILPRNQSTSDALIRDALIRIMSQTANSTVDR